MNTGEHILLVVFWAIFGLLHSLLASPYMKERVRWRYYRAVYSVFALVKTGFIFLYLFSVESVLLWEGGQGFFVMTAIAGLLVMAISIRKYFYRLSGVQALYKKQEGQVLEQKGMHEYVRHPLYGGTLLFAWSLFFLFPYLSFLLTCASMTVYTLIGIRHEEKKLENLFGQQYRVYKNNVPMIIPFTKFGRLSKPSSN